MKITFNYKLTEDELEGIQDNFKNYTVEDWKVVVYTHNLETLEELVWLRGIFTERHLLSRDTEWDFILDYNEF